MKSTDDPYFSALVGPRTHCFQFVKISLPILPSTPNPPYHTILYPTQPLSSPCLILPTSPLLPYHTPTLYPLPSLPPNPLYHLTPNPPHPLPPYPLLPYPLSPYPTPSLPATPLTSTPYPPLHLPYPNRLPVVSFFKAMTKFSILCLTLHSKVMFAWVKLSSTTFQAILGFSIINR